MFGTLRPSLCGLRVDDRQAYRRSYCGTCKALGDDYGQLARPLLSYDMVFLAAIVEGCQREASPTATCRCPALPVLQKPIIDPASPSVRVSAAVQMILAAAWLEDQVADGSAAYRPALALARPKAAKAHGVLASLGIDLSASHDLSQRQAEIERVSKDLRELAAPTSDVLASIFGQLPNLFDSAPLDSDARDALVALGQALGLAIYAVDALEDLQDDVEVGAFNPCIDGTGRVSLLAVDNASALLAESLNSVALALNKIPFARGEAGIRAAARGLVKRGREAMAACESRRESWAELRRRTTPERWLRAFWTSLLWLPLWLHASGTRAWRRARASERHAMEVATCATHHALALGAGGSLSAGPNPIDPGTGQPPGGGSRRPKGPTKRPAKDSGASSWFCVDCCCTDCCDCGNCCSGCDCGDCCGCGD